MAQVLSEGPAGSPKTGRGWADSCQEVQEGALCSHAVGFGRDLVSHWEILLLFPSDLLNLQAR